MAGNGTRNKAGVTTTEEQQVLLFNVTDWPVVYTNDSRILGGGERLWVNTSVVDSMTYYVIAQGWIIVKKGTLPPPPAPAANGDTGQVVDHVADAQPQAEKTGESVPA